MSNLKTKTLSALLLAAVTLSGVAGFGGTARAGRGSSYSQIMQAIESDNADAIISELERAERLVCGPCIEPVKLLLDNDDYRVREAAAWWFARRPALKAQIHDDAVARLYGDDPVLARNGADALGTFRHPDAIPALAYATTRQDFPAETRVAAVRALGTIAHPTAKPAIVAALGDGSPEVRAEAVNSYYLLRGDHDGAPLVALVADADPSVRRVATATLGSIVYAPARPALEHALATDTDFQVRRNAAFALGKIGDGASRNVLVAAADGDPSSVVRSVASAAIRGLR